MRSSAEFPLPYTESSSTTNITPDVEDPFQGVLKVEVIAETLQVDIEECIRCLGALDLLEAGALGTSVQRDGDGGWAPPEALPSTGEELSVARAAPPRRRRSPEKSKPELLEIFQSYDVNGDKAIDKKEMQKARGMDGSGVKTWRSKAFSSILLVFIDM